MLELARQVQGQFPEESPQRQGIVEAAELLGATVTAGCGNARRMAQP